MNVSTDVHMRKHTRHWKNPEETAWQRRRSDHNYCKTTTVFNIRNTEQPRLCLEDDVHRKLEARWRGDWPEKQPRVNEVLPAPCFTDKMVFNMVLIQIGGKQAAVDLIVNESFFQRTPLSLFRPSDHRRVLRFPRDPPHNLQRSSRWGRRGTFNALWHFEVRKRETPVYWAQLGI